MYRHRCLYYPRFLNAVRPRSMLLLELIICIDVERRFACNLSKVISAATRNSLTYSKVIRTSANNRQFIRIYCVLLHPLIRNCVFRDRICVRVAIISRLFVYFYQRPRRTLTNLADRYDVCKCSLIQSVSSPRLSTSRYFPSSFVTLIRMKVGVDYTIIFPGQGD